MTDSLDIAQISIYGLSFLSAGFFLFLPLVNLLHPNPWQRLMATIHSIAPIFALVAIVYTRHLAFPLLPEAGKILLAPNAYISLICPLRCTLCTLLLLVN